MPVLSFDVPNEVADELERMASATGTTVQALIIAALRNRLFDAGHPDSFGAEPSDVGSNQPSNGTALRG